MAVTYADRAFLAVNGVNVADIQSSSVRQNFNSRPVDTMTPDKFNRGFVQGNTHIDVGFSLAVQKGLARPKIDQIDFEANDISIHYFVGADEFVVGGCFKKDASDASSGVGTESKFDINIGGTTFTDAVGNAAELFDLDLG